MKNIPIVVIHKGNPEYLALCLRQIRHFNPDSRIILLGDASNRHFVAEGVEHFDVDMPELGEEVGVFREMYQHFSSLPFEFERFCIERWFILRNLMRQENWDACLHLDSDVLIFCNVDAEARRFSDYAMTFAHWDERRNLIHTNFINSRIALESFCDSVLEVYRSPEKLDELKELNLKKSCKPGKLARYWISDMSLMYIWSQSAGFKYCFLEDFHKEGICFDARINFVSEFRSFHLLPGMIRPYKRIVFRDGIPWGILKDGTPVVFKSLHHYGYYKCMMPFHAEGKHPKWRILARLLGVKVTNTWRKIKLQFLKSWRKS